jgi:hypothetical protein
MDMSLPEAAAQAGGQGRSLDSSGHEPIEGGRRSNLRRSSTVMLASHPHCSFVQVSG